MPNIYLDLLDYRRQVLDLYDGVRRRAEDDPALAWEVWREQRDHLFGTHPQTALPAERLKSFRGLSYFDYDPALRFSATIVASNAPAPAAISTSTDETMSFFSIGHVELPIGRLQIYWLKDYGGGIFIPFRDQTGGKTTYGGGRYLLDTAKGADLGSDDRGRLILDFNFAYNPSCHYDPRWNCPLSPPANRLSVAIRAGEQMFEELVDA